MWPDAPPIKRDSPASLRAAHQTDQTGTGFCAQPRSRGLPVTSVTDHPPRVESRIPRPARLTACTDLLPARPADPGQVRTRYPRCRPLVDPPAPVRVARATRRLRDTARAMSQKNVDLVRRGHDAFRTGGEEAPFAFFDADIDLSPIEELPGVENYRGHDGVRRYFEVIRDAFGEFGWQPLEFIDLGDHVLVVTRFDAQGRSSGIPVEATIYNVFTVRDGQVVQVRGWLDRADALNAVGLAE
jgi:uncharacterized protein